MVRAANRLTDGSVVEQRICSWKDRSGVPDSRVTQEQLPRSNFQGAVTEEQLPSASDVTISNYLNYSRKIAVLRSMTPVFRLIRVSLEKYWYKSIIQGLDNIGVLICT
jgi:hypothetical protein